MRKLKLGTGTIGLWATGLGVSLVTFASCSDDANLGNDDAREGVTTNDDSEQEPEGSSVADDDDTDVADDDGDDLSNPEPETASGGAASSDDEPDDIGGGDDPSNPEPETASGGAASSDDEPDDMGGGDDPSNPEPETASGGAAQVEPEPEPGSDDCEDIQCFRAIECVETCGGPVLVASCCPCAEGTFDSIECTTGSGGASGEGGASQGGAAQGGASQGGASQGGATSTEYDLSQLNTDCVDDACTGNLTPVHFFGIAGPQGPEFCWCTIPCAEDPDICPETTMCVTVSDGPGEVCYAEEENE